MGISSYRHLYIGGGKVARDDTPQSASEGPEALFLGVGITLLQARSSFDLSGVFCQTLTKFF